MKLLEKLGSLMLARFDTDEEWRDFLAAWYEHVDGFSTGVGQHIRDEEMGKFLCSLVIPALRNGFATSERQLDLFNRLQSVGAHLLPVHFYSPIPDTSALPEELSESRYDVVPGWSLNVALQLDLLSDLGRFSGELGELLEHRHEPDSFQWDNKAFNVTDASLYYALIRLLKPAKVIEVGGGYSSCIAAIAALRNGDTVLDVVEPYPQPFLVAERPGLHHLIREPVQSVLPEIFTSLDANDILFIDSSHVCKVGSDVTYLILEILPRLKPGVVVHFHDIFLPWNLPRKWTTEHRLFWNEQYLLLAFLQGNRDFEVLLAAHYLGRCHPEKVMEVFPYISLPGGGSFWIRRREAEVPSGSEGALRQL